MKSTTGKFAMSVLTPEERAKGLTPSPIDNLVEEVKRLRAENAELRAELARRPKLCEGKLPTPDWSPD